MNTGSCVWRRSKGSRSSDSPLVGYDFRFVSKGASTPPWVDVFVPPSTTVVLGIPGCLQFAPIPWFHNWSIDAMPTLWPKTQAYGLSIQSPAELPGLGVCVLIDLWVQPIDQYTCLVRSNVNQSRFYRTQKQYGWIEMLLSLWDHTTYDFRKHIPNLLACYLWDEFTAVK